MKINIQLSFLSIILFGLFSLSAFSQEPIPGVDNIKKENLLKTDKFLSSKELDGRNPGTAGFEKAAAYMSEEFSKIGLKPLGDSSYYQFFKVEANQILAPCRFNRYENGKIVKEYQLGKDFVCRGFSGAGTIEAPVVFCGYGISQPDSAYDDYAGIDVKDKLVMIFKPNPGWTKDKHSWPAVTERTKGPVAKAHGALGVLYISLPNDKNPQKTIGSVLHGKGEQDINFPQLHIDLPVAEEFLAKSGYSLSKLQQMIDTLKKPMSINTGIKVGLEVHTKYTNEARVENLIGCIEGSDSALKHQYIILGAHLDHVGSQGEEIYFPGANDNASGSSAVLEIARAFMKSPVKPKRSIIFILFSSEEQGCLGSEYCASHLPIPADSVVAMLNMDCVGFGDSIQMGNGKSAPLLWKMIKAEDSLYIKRAVSRTWNGGGADLGAFHNKGIPGVYFVNTNSYVHLHCITDKVETLNGPLFEDMTKLAYIAAFRLAQGDYKREKVLK